MKNIKISTRLIGGFLLIAVMTACVELYMEYNIKHIDDNAITMHDKGIIPLGLLITTADLVQEVRVQIREWRLAKTDGDRASAQKLIDISAATLKELINKQKDLTLAESGKQPLEDLYVSIDKYIIETQNYIDSCLLSGLAEADFSSKMVEAGVEMRKKLEAAMEQKTENLEVLFKQNSDTALQVEFISMVALVVTLIFSVIFGFILTFSITKPLDIIVDVISKIEKGDMTVRAKLERKDRLGLLSRAMDNLSAKLQTIFKNLQQDADTVASSAEELSNVGNEVTIIAEESLSQSTMVASSAEQTAVNINAMASGAEEASLNANEVAGVAEQMSANMNTIAAAIEEMSASISEISSNANEASIVVHEASDKSQEATSAMNKLGIAAKEIGQVTNVIKSIADKTNLLALNATIEAASAGEAGKGFAVVAGEIKELANRSAQSADDIARRINGIQAGTNEAVTVIEKVSNIIVKINHSVEQIYDHIAQQTKASNEIANNVAQANSGAKRVASAIGDVAKGSRDIARNADEAAKGANIISQNVANIAQSSKESVHGAKQVNQSSGELAKIANALKNVLSQFKV